MRSLVLIALTLVACAQEAEPARAEKGDASPTAAADRAYGEGVAAFDRAQAADALGRAEEAKRELVAARAALDDAIARYRALIAASATAMPDAQRRLADAVMTGKTCCGKTSLWKKYAVASPGEVAAAR